jgi:hypothetical protein
MNPDMVVRYWTLVGPSGDVVLCQLVRTPHGFEVQCGAADSERVLRATIVKTVTDGFNLSESWRAAYTANGWQPGPSLN